MLELSTWDEAIKPTGSTFHGPTIVLGLHELAHNPTFDVNSISVSENDDGSYDISLEVLADLCSGISREQVITTLQRLRALDEEWE